MSLVVKIGKAGKAVLRRAGPSESEKDMLSFPGLSFPVFSFPVVFAG